MDETPQITSSNFDDIIEEGQPLNHIWMMSSHAYELKFFEEELL